MTTGPNTSEPSGPITPAELGELVDNAIDHARTVTTSDPVDVPALFRQLRAMQYRTDAMSVIDALEAAVTPLPDRVEQPGDVLLVGRLAGGPFLPEPVIAVRVNGNGGMANQGWSWLIASRPASGRRWFHRRDLHDVTTAYVVPEGALEDIATLAHGIEHAEFDRPSPAETVAHHRIVARRIVDAVDGLTGGA